MSVANTVTDIDQTNSEHARQARFDELFRAHRQRLVDTLTVVAGDRERAADAVQEAFVKAHLKWRKIDRYDDPIGWVRRVAINRLKDEHRRDKRKRSALTRLASEPAQTPAAEHNDDVREKLASLPRQQRLCLALFYVDGLPIADIAEALGIAQGSVKSHLHDGRRNLRAIVSREQDHT